MACGLGRQRHVGDPATCHECCGAGPTCSRGRLWYSRAETIAVELAANIMMAVIVVEFQETV